MSALSPADQRRLQGSLARLASPHEGEVLAAVKAVERLLAKADALFSDLTLQAALPPPVRRPEHQRRAEELLASDYAWNPWALAFLEEIASWRAPISARQQDVLRELEAEALDRAA